MPPLDLLIEAERRGILPADKKSLLDEARSRGLVPGNEPQVVAQQTSTVNQPPAPMSILQGLAFPFVKTGEEFMQGLSELGHVPQPGDSYLGGIARRGMGVLQAAASPATGFITEPLRQMKLGEMMINSLIPPFLRDKVPEPVKQVANETAAVGGTILAAPWLTKFPGTVARAATEGITSRLTTRQALRGTIASEQAAREAAGQEAQSYLQDLQGAASNVGGSAEDAAKAREAAQRAVTTAKGMPLPPPPPLVDPKTAAAVAQLQQFPLRVDPTNIPAVDEAITQAGQSYAGLFRTAAKQVKNRFSDRIKEILPATQLVSDVTPIQVAAQKILPEAQIAKIGTQAQSIAGGIDEVLTNPKLSWQDKADAAAQRIRNLASGFAPGSDKTQINLADVMGTRQGNELAAKLLQQPGVSPSGSTAVLPALQDIHGERIVIRAMKRAAEKNGHNYLAGQLGVLEKGYTETINNAVGTDKAAALAQWDKDYGYAVRNLFGFDSLPYKLSGQKAEDFATSLFKTSGKAQAETAARTMELLGPEQRQQMGQSFLNVVAKKSQTPELPFDPVKWGKEYFSYKDAIKQSVLSPEHKAALDDIARTFVSGPSREQVAQATFKAAKESRLEAIRSAAGDERAAIAAFKDFQEQLKGTPGEPARHGLIKEKNITERTISRLEKPTALEAQSAEELSKLDYYKNLAFVRATGLRQLTWGLGALSVGKSYGLPLTTEAGILLTTVEGIGMLLKNDRGARLVATLVKARPGTEAAITAASRANALLQSLNPQTPTPGQ